jgi:phage tail-like protein
VASGNGTALGADPRIQTARCFRVQVSKLTIGVFTRCSGLEVEYEVMEYAEGGENGYVHKLRGRMRYPNLLLSSGVTKESEMLDWLFSSEEPGQRPAATISLLDEAGAVQRSWVFGQALPVRWIGPALIDSGEVAGESLEIAHTGLLRA